MRSEPEPSSTPFSTRSYWAPRTARGRSQRRRRLGRQGEQVVAGPARPSPRRSRRAGSPRPRQGQRADGSARQADEGEAQRAEHLGGDHRLVGDEDDQVAGLAADLATSAACRRRRGTSRCGRAARGPRRRHAGQALAPCSFASSVSSSSWRGRGNRRRAPGWPARRRRRRRRRGRPRTRSPRRSR